MAALLLLLRLAPAAGGQQPGTIGHSEDLEAALELNRQAREAGEYVPGTAESTSVLAVSPAAVHVVAVPSRITAPQKRAASRGAQPSAPAEGAV